MASFDSFTGKPNGNNKFLNQLNDKYKEQCKRRTITKADFLLLEMYSFAKTYKDNVFYGMDFDSYMEDKKADLDNLSSSILLTVEDQDLREDFEGVFLSFSFMNQSVLDFEIFESRACELLTKSQIYVSGYIEYTYLEREMIKESI